VDGVAAQARVGAVMDGNACGAVAGDIAALQFQASLADVHGIPGHLAARLSQGQVGNPANVGAEHHHVGIAGVDLNVGDWAVAEDFQRLVDDQTLGVEAGPDQDAVAGSGRLDGLADGGEIGPVEGIDYMGRRLCLDSAADRGGLRG
jgi:hypothetical protein